MFPVVREGLIGAGGGGLGRPVNSGLGVGAGFGVDGARIGAGNFGAGIGTGFAPLPEPNFGVGIGTAVRPPLSLNVGVGIGTGVYLGAGIVLPIDGPDPTLLPGSNALSFGAGVITMLSAVLPSLIPIFLATVSKLDIAFAGDGKGVDFLAMLVT